MCHSRVIVSKEEVVICSAVRCWIDWSTQIAVNEFEGLRSPCRRLVRRLPVLLSFQTRLAYAHFRSGFYSHSIHHSRQLLDVFFPQMYHPPVPGVDVKLTCRLHDSYRCCICKCICQCLEAKKSSCDTYRV